MSHEIEPIATIVCTDHMVIEALRSLVTTMITDEAKCDVGPIYYDDEVWKVDLLPNLSDEGQR